MMPGWTLNREGQNVWLDENGQVSPAPPNAPLPPSRDTTRVLNAAPAPPPGGELSQGGGFTPTPRQQLRHTPIIPGQDPSTQGGSILGAPEWGHIPLSADWLRNLGTNFGNLGTDISNWWRSPVGGTTPSPAESGTSSGSTLGAIAGNAQPLFDPNAPLVLQPEDQVMAEVFAAIRDRIQPSERPEPPAVTADPAIAAQVAIAEGRRDRLAPHIQEQIDNIIAERERHEGRSNMQQFGEWLGRWAASGDPGYGGAALTDMRERTAARRREWTNDIIRLQEAGYSLEEAVAQASAGVASAEHEASQTTADRGYQAALGRADAQEEARAREVQALLAEAENRRESVARALERDQAALAALLNVPGHENEASAAMAQRAFPGNARASAALSQGLAEERRLATIAQRLAGPYGNRDDFRDLRTAARRIDRNLTDEQINRIAQMLSAAPTQ